MQKMETLRKETMEKATAVLTADQAKTWKEMTGAPFEVKFEMASRAKASRVNPSRRRTSRRRSRLLSRCRVPCFRGR